MKKEVKDLKAELSLLKGGEQRDNLSSEDIERCNVMVNNFIKSDDPSHTLVLPDRLMINQCFYYFRTQYKNALKKGGNQLAIMPETPSKVDKDDGVSN